ncbi:DegV domain-containing protein [Erysipelotrichaceae bacterium]|nr:DegV domain-containing protein [Erysipelotrichaceae bacterium]
MKKFAFLLDSTLATTKSEVEKKDDFFFLPLYVVIDGVLYKDMEEISLDTFYEKMREGYDVTTSQISSGEFLQKYEKIREQGYTDVFVFTLASKMSGTMQSAIVAGGLVQGIDIHVVETATVSAIGTIAVEQIAKFSQTTQDPAEIRAFADDVFSRVAIYVYVDNLETLKKGGRISAAKAMIGTVLQIKPILIIRDGVIDVIGKERTLKKAIKGVLDAAQKVEIEYAIILHSSQPELVELMRAQCALKYPLMPLEVAGLSPVIGAHIGPNTVAFAVIEKQSS